MEDKKIFKISLTLMLILFLSLTLVSAGWFGDMWGRITGRAIQENLSESEVLLKNIEGFSSKQPYCYDYESEFSCGIQYESKGNTSVAVRIFKTDSELNETLQNLLSLYERSDKENIMNHTIEREVIYSFLDTSNFYVWVSNKTLVTTSGTLSEETLEITRKYLEKYPSNTQTSAGVDTNETLNKNTKDISKFSSKNAFLVSDEDWRRVMTLVPLTVWTNSDNTVTKYPLLIYHKEGNSFDIDSAYYFFEQYNPDKITYFENIPSALNSLISHSFTTEQKQSILDYWMEYTDVVYVEENYELALVASTYASLINAPLIIKNYNDNLDLFEKNVICIGNPTYNCDEKYSLDQLQKKYLQKTNTDKIILVNPNDLQTYVESQPIPLERTSGDLNKFYWKLSLTSPYLASSKRQLILPYSYSDYGSINNFITSRVNDLGINAKYLTIIASPNMIPFARNDTAIMRDFIQDIFGTRPSGWTQVDNSLYADLNGDFYQDIAVGRIFSFSNSDVSSYIARVVFYEELTKPTEFASLTSFEAMYAAPYHYNQFIDYVLSGSGLTKKSIYQEYAQPFQPSIFKNKLILTYEGHGGQTGLGSGFTTDSFRQNRIWLNNTIIATGACLSCSFNTVSENFQSQLFCSEMIRRGALAYVGATDAMFQNTPVQLNFIYWISKGLDMGTAFKHATNSHFPDRDLKYSPFQILLGDPTFNPKIQISDSEDIVKLEQSNFVPISQNKFVKFVNISILPTQTSKLTNLRNNYYTHLDLNSPMYYGGENTFRSHIYYLNQTKDSGAAGGFNLEVSSDDLVITFKFENPNNYTLIRVKNAKMKLENNVIDITEKLIYESENPFAKPVFLINNNGTSYIYLYLNLNQNGNNLVEPNTDQIPAIGFDVEFEFLKSFIPSEELNCTNFTYSEWGECIDGNQTREVISAYPENCVGGEPVLERECPEICTEENGMVYFQREMYSSFCLDNLTLNKYYCGVNLLRWDFWNAFERVPRTRTTNCPYGCENAQCLDEEVVIPEPECERDNECSDGKFCLEGVCVSEPECSQDEDCDDLKICRNGVCILDLPDEPRRPDEF
jgi:hypothetical protein